ncbi:AfsR/SARP family transcriptional regulator [Amycolatopsis sp. DG1A-15b]|uniref:AfsR/SARP family transcriptional regulator n=1 Tax=Amycolatopsis sp. DG1A-15b TaxID=3052846 RepID=UPI00255B7762|nr:AfsR/SARP family transcriptional regulator [Amycolatopsis sp. DG1A-15b]WIX90453.1 BTAD domain-containing putative transcriptional regulator [Amycolatopsis sp. DG1A-15b]
MLEATVLGPVGARVHGTPVPIKGRLGRTVLAVLALACRQPVSVERLIDALWGELPPATARTQVHIQVSKLRAALDRAGAAGAVVTVASGYLLDCLVDVDEVRRLLSTARAAGDPADAAGLLRSALDRWAGTPLGGVTPYLAGAELLRLDELRMCLVEEWIDAELACGRAARLLPELSALVQAHPLREGLHQRRMLALHRAGRRADALAAFHEARRVLRDELGVDPSRELLALEAEVLAVEAPPAATVVPAQLPPRTSGFAGRAAESAAIRAAVARRSDAPPLVLVTGMPGIGKTALAVHAGAASVHAYPDGQLYADLRGADARPAAPHDILAGFLRALGVPARSMPATVEERTAEFRSRTAGKRVLVLLDNAATAWQIEPLLAADPGCATIVTSRSVLPEVESAVRVPLGPLPDEVAGTVLANVAGAARLDDGDGDGTVAAVIQACGGVPLALRIAGAQLAAYPKLSVAELAARLSDESRRMRELVAGQRSVRDSLDTSFRLLDREGRAAMLALAAIGAPTFTGWPLAPVLDVPLARTGEVLAHLCAMNLLDQAGPGRDGVPRYRMHDLVRAYCRTVGPSLDAGPVNRLAGWAVALTRHAYEGILGTPAGYTVLAETAAPIGRNVAARVVKEPLSWVGADVDVLLAVFALAVRGGLLRPAAALLLVLRAPLVRLDLYDHGARAAARLTTVAGQDPVVRVTAALVTATARMHRSRYADVVAILDEVPLRDVDFALRAEVLTKLGDAYERCGDWHRAITAVREAVVCFRKSGNLAGMSGCHGTLAALYRDHLGDLCAATVHGAKALRLADAAGEWKTCAQVRLVAVRTALACGDPAAAVSLAGQARVLSEQHGDPIGRTWCLTAEADAHRANGDLPAARRSADRALGLARRIRRPDAESAALLALASIELAAGDRAAARRIAHESLRLQDRFDSPVERVGVERVLAEIDCQLPSGAGR